MNAGFWNDRYSQTSFLYGEEPNEFLREAAVVLKSGSQVLSLGEGEGRNAVWLARNGYRVTAVDQSVMGRDKALQLASKHQIRLDYQIQSVQSGPWMADSWDGIVNIFCHLPSADRHLVYAGIHQSLKPGGYFISEQFSPEQLNYQSGGPKDADMLVTPEEIRREFGTGYEIIRLEGCVIQLDEGHHSGPGSVTRVVVRKQ